MIYIFRWLFGFVSFTFKKGFREDFLTDCFACGIELRDIETMEDCLTASCNLKSYKKLHRIARRHGGVLKIIKKRGLPFLLLPLKNRLGFFVGMAAFCLIISLLGSFVWNIEIVGNNKISDTTVLAFLENNNLKKGAMWNSFDRDELAWDMLSSFEDFSWVHINKIGTTARIEINETTDAPEPDTDKLQGTNIFRRELKATINREQNSIISKDVKLYHSIKFFSATIPLSFNRPIGDVSSESTVYLKIKDIELPIGYTEYQEQFLSSVSQTLTDDELKDLAKRRLEAQERTEFDGFEIVNKTESYNVEAESCTAIFTYVIRRK
ncbi:MAG: sporulation protein YqfD [Clostridium sp.]|nr:sporulation protein YqfD [Clostridium sp.]